MINVFVNIYLYILDKNLLLKMETETPHWEINNNKKSSKHLSKYIGKNCLICFKESFWFPPLSSMNSTNHMNAIIQEYDSDYLVVSLTVKKKVYSATLNLNNISAIATEKQ